MSESEPARSPATITVLYFAAALTATGTASETIELPIASSSSSKDSTSPGFPLSALAELLSRRHAGTNLDKILKSSQWSVDAEMIDDPESVLLQGGEEVAVICPVSGG
ncbi:hypothetical protein ACEPAF_8655 [Sanghuangporus sanghuang]